VFLDAPHRLFPLLEDLTDAFGSGRPAAVAIELTRKGEAVHRGTLEQLRDYYGTHKRKCDFVIIVEAAPRSHRGRGRR
jgi:16S rRNA (cytidine1402-2'-O)-methyltransferase